MWPDWLSVLDAPDERLYAPFLLSALALAVVAAAFGRVSLREDVFSRRLWWHPSACADYLFFAVRLLLSAAVFAPLLVSSTVVAVKVVLALYALVGPPPAWPLSAGATTVLYTACLFVVSDASRFVVHKAMHEVAFLWRFHQVHHSAEVMTPVTLYRTHPVEGLLMAWRGIVVTGLVGGIFSWLTVGRAVSAEIVGVNAIAFVFNLAGSNLRHSHVWMPWGPLEWLFISPAQHQLHHSRDTGGFGVNYGSFLSVWDLLWGSWLRARERPKAFGLEPHVLNHHPRKWWSLFVGPFYFVL